MCIDLISREVLVKDKPITLTPKEFELLALLAKSTGRSCSREQLLEDVWGVGHKRTTPTTGH